jgi:hypothetical protein
LTLLGVCKEVGNVHDLHIAASAHQLLHEMQQLEMREL